ncbi:MAG: flippase-like domain-containing protein [Acidobacteria bacterium]|nr:flippase-like domain-containing protein [Acidobacteriota bacterium]
MNDHPQPHQTGPEATMTRIKLAAVVLTLLGIGLFSYLVYSVGITEILDGIAKFGFVGFAVILALYFVRICIRAFAWKLSVHEPYSLEMRDTVPAVVIGEAMSSTFPLGILVSGTAKAIAVRRRIPLVAGLSSVATENLFYSLVTGIFLVLGAAFLLGSFAVDDNTAYVLMFIISSLLILMTLGVIMVIRQWHMASETAQWLYHRGIAHRFLGKLRMDIRIFENLIYGFYRRHPNRFIPIVLLEAAFHSLGILEVWFILFRIGDTLPPVVSAFLLESVSRLITVVFKLVPFLIGVDEAGAQFVAEVLAIGAGVGVTLAIIRKGRILFWATIGYLLILKRGLSIREFRRRDVS